MLLVNTAAAAAAVELISISRVIVNVTAAAVSGYTSFAGARIISHVVQTWGLYLYLYFGREHVILLLLSLPRSR